MEHHASNTSLKDTNRAQDQHLLGKEKHASVKHFLPAVCGHTLVTAVFFIPFFALDGRVVTTCSHTDARHRGGVAGAVHFHLHLKNEERGSTLGFCSCSFVSTVVSLMSASFWYMPNVVIN